jgi:hypothetical protein
MDALTLLGDDVGLLAWQYQVIHVLDLYVQAWVGDYCVVYPDVVVITKIQELLPGELGAVVGDDRVGDPKAENNVLDKTRYLLGADFG